MQPILYNKYGYLYPVRPTNKISPEELDKYDTGEYLAQPKYDGSCINLFLAENFMQVMNRHNEAITNPFMDEIDYRSIYKGSGFMVVSGELLNKNKVGEDGNFFNKKLVLWDILVYNSKYLVGQTTAQRLELLEYLFPSQRMMISSQGFESYNHICTTRIKGVYKAPTYSNGFLDLYNDLTKTQIYEGVVLKRTDAKLGFGFTERNNFEHTLKCRKETKNYRF